MNPQPKPPPPPVTEELLELQAAQHDPTCRVHDTGSTDPDHCTCGLHQSQELAGDRSTR